MTEKELQALKDAVREAVQEALKEAIGPTVQEAIRLAIQSQRVVVGPHQRPYMRVEAIGKPVAPPPPPARNRGREVVG